MSRVAVAVAVPPSALEAVRVAVTQARRDDIRRIAAGLGVTYSTARQIVDGELRVEYAHDVKTVEGRWRYLHRKGVMP